LLIKKTTKIKNRKKKKERLWAYSKTLVDVAVLGIGLDDSAGSLRMVC
jgi:hypothetical protein